MEINPANQTATYADEIAAATSPHIRLAAWAIRTIGTAARATDDKATARELRKVAKTLEALTDDTNPLLTVRFGEINAAVAKAAEIVTGAGPEGWVHAGRVLRQLADTLATHVPGTPAQIVARDGGYEIV